MDWDRAIERNSGRLKAILAALFAMLEEAGGRAVEKIPRSLHSAILLVLRPAESAVRRLIVIAARGVVVKPRASRPGPQGPIKPKAGPAGPGGRGPERLAFPIFDPQKRFEYQRRKYVRGVGPRIRVIYTDDPRIPIWRLGLAPPPPPEPPPAPPPRPSLIGARRLVLRLEAARRALDDLPRQARRLARWLARREKAWGVRFPSPLRPGRPPGARKKPRHEIDDVLEDCHAYAYWSLIPDTS